MRLKYTEKLFALSNHFYIATQNQFQSSMTNLQAKIFKAGGIVSALFLLTIPFSTSISIILSGVLLLIWLITFQFKQLPWLLRNNPVALFSLLLFVGLLFGISYSSAPFKDAINMWAKYREFFLLIVLLPFLSSSQHKKWMIYAFIAGMIGTLLISYAMYFDFIPRPRYAATLKSIITQSIMISFFGYYCALQIKNPEHIKNRIFWCLLLIICIHNVHFVAIGRTGQLLGLLFVFLFCFQHLNAKLSIFLISFLAVFFALFINYSEMGFRITEGFQNVLNYDFSNPVTETSMGRRLTFWQYSLTLIKESPWFGYGTGSFETEFKRLADSNQYINKNPHSEYLSLAVQLGIPGLILYLGFLFSQYRMAQQLEIQKKWFAQGLLLSITVTSIFNSPILDHTEGHWFVCLLALCYAQQTIPKNA